MEFQHEELKHRGFVNQTAWAKPYTRETTQIYTHVMTKPGIGVRSPLDGL